MSEKQLPGPNSGRNLSGGFWTFFRRRPHALPAMIGGVMLLLAIGKWPYDYYRLLRWAVCAAGVLSAVLCYKYEKHWAIAPFAVAAALFNPVAPMHLRRETWAVLDLLAGIMFLGMAAVPLKRAQPRKASPPAASAPRPPPPRPGGS